MSENKKDVIKENEKIEEPKKQIEILSDDGSTLDISPVYENLNAVKPKSTENKPKNIVIPKAKKQLTCGIIIKKETKSGYVINF